MNHTVKVLVTIAKSPEKQARFRAQLERELGPTRLARLQLAFASGEEAILAGLPGQHVLIGVTVTPAMLAAGRELAWVQLISAGVEHVLTPELFASPVVVANARGMHVTHMSEHVLAFVFAFARFLPQCMRWQRSAEWRQRDVIDRVWTLAGRTAGIVGLGAIGLGCAQRMSALGMRVIGLKRRAGPVPAGVDEVVGPEGLDSMLARSDVVVIATPLTDATRGLIDERRIDLMKRGAILVNIARGAIVDEAAMIRALERGHLAGAGLDVFATEPLPADSPLWKLENVVITPHSSGNYPGYVEQATSIFADNLARYLAGEPLVNVVDKQAGY